MKSAVIGLGNDVDENVRRILKTLGLSDEEIEQKINERFKEKSQEEIEAGFRYLFTNR